MEIGKNAFVTKSSLFSVDPYKWLHCCMCSLSNSDLNKQNKNLPTGCTEGQQIMVLSLRCLQSLDCVLWVPKLLSSGINMSKPLKVAFYHVDTERVVSRQQDRGMLCSAVGNW